MSPYRFLANYLRSRYDHVWLDRPDSPWTTLLPSRMIVPLGKGEGPPPADALVLAHESLPADQLPPGRVPGLNLWRYRYAETEEAVGRYLAYLVQAWLAQRKSADVRRNVLLVGFGTVGRVLYSELATDARLAGEGYQFAITDDDVSRWRDHPDFIPPELANYTGSLCVITPWQADGFRHRLQELSLQEGRDWIACPFWRPAMLEMIGYGVQAVPWVARHAGRCSLKEGALLFGEPAGGPAVPLRFLAWGRRYCGPWHWPLLRSVGQLTPFHAPGGVRFALPAGYDASFESGTVYLGDREDAFVEHAVLARLAESLGWPAFVRQLWRELFTTSLTGLTPTISHQPIRGPFTDLERLLLTFLALWAGRAGRHILETGTMAGASTYHLALGLRIAEAPGRLWSANRWQQGRMLAMSLLGSSQLEGYVNHLAADSPDRRMPPGLRAQIVIFHGTQDYPTISQSLLDLLPALEPRGVMAVCDYGPEAPGVVRAVQEQLFASRLRALAQVDRMILLRPL